MTRDDIIRLAQEAGLLNQTAPGVIWSCPVPSDDYPDRIERFAALVAAAEREACAKLCEEKQSYFTPIPCPDGISGCLVAHHGPVQRKKTATECAAAIRARGEA